MRSIVKAPWYARNSDIHRELGVETIADIIVKYATSHEIRLLSHVNEEAVNLTNTEAMARRLKRTKPFELVSLRV